MFYAAPLKHFPHRAAPLSAVATVRFRELGARAGAAVRECPRGPRRYRLGLGRAGTSAFDDHLLALGGPGADTRALTGAASIDEALDALFTSFDLKEH